MLNYILICIIVVLFGIIWYIHNQLQISRSKVRGSITVVQGVVVVSDVYLEGVTLDVTHAGRISLQRVHAHKCNPALYTGSPLR